MLKITSIFWVVLSVIIIIIPVLHLSFFVSMKIIKVVKRIAYKLFKITIFKKIKTDIMDESNQSDIQTVFENKISMKKYLEKTKEIWLIIRNNIKQFWLFVVSKISRIDVKSLKKKLNNISVKLPKLEQDVVEEKKSDISYEEVKITYNDANFLWVTLNLKSVIHGSQESNNEKPIEELSIEERESILRNKKLIERIIYEALVFKKEWKFEEYEKKIIEWLAIDSEDKDLNKLLAEYYFSIWNHKKALSLLKKIIDVDHKDHKAIRQIWEIYLVWGEYDVAEILINRAVSMDGDNPKYYASLVELLYNTDRRLDAITVLEKELLRLRPTNMDYLVTLAELYEEMWEIQNAKKYYFRILEQDPSNEKIKRKLQKITEESIL